MEKYFFGLLKNENEFPDELVSFLNILENAEEISKEKINVEEPDKETTEKFIKSLLLEDRINDECYSLILKSIPYIYNTLGISKLSEGKVHSLIKNNVLSTNNINFETLKNFKEFTYFFT